MCKPNQPVKVARILENEVSRSFLGKTGKVESTPRTKRNEGLYIVAFPNGKRDGFYPEELKAI